MYMKKLSLAIVGVVLLSGCSLSPAPDSTPTSSTSQTQVTTTQETKVYSGDGFSFEYPASYTVTKGDYGVTVSGPEGSVIVSSVALDIAPANAVGTPKDIVSHGYSGHFSSGLQYDGETAQSALLKIRDSITVTK